MKNTLQLMQIEDMMGKVINTDPYHVDVIKNTLTRHISSQFTNIQEEVLATFQDELPNDGWYHFKLRSRISF